MHLTVLWVVFFLVNSLDFSEGQAHTANEIQTVFHAHAKDMSALQPIEDLHLPQEGKLFLCFDYDGTLRPRGNNAFNTDKRGRLVAFLKALSEIPRIEMHILSARPSPRLVEIFQTVPKAGLAAEGGLLYRAPTESDFERVYERLSLPVWLGPTVAQIKQYLPQKNIIEKDKFSSFAVNCQGYEPDYVLGIINNALAPYGDKIDVFSTPQSDMIEIRPSKTGKDAHVEKMLRNENQYVGGFYVGDDFLDESVFHLVNTWSEANTEVTMHSVHVYNSAGTKSLANFKVGGPAALLNWLKKEFLPGWEDTFTNY